MKLRAVICDVYGTLLQLGPPPADAASHWDSLWSAKLAQPPRLSLAQFATACDQAIAREHAAARAAGILFPEVFWPAVVGELLPELMGLAPAERDEFLFCQAKIWHTVRLMPGAAEALRKFQRAGLLLGLASNAQPYTIREVDAALTGAGLASAMFTANLCFWSFEHGFSKPDPHVFRLLTARLRARGIGPAETLMVGDRLDHDIEPARKQGWQTWHWRPGTEGEGAGDWTRLCRVLNG